MRWLGKTKRNAGWLAFSLEPDGIVAAHVMRPPGGKPAVELAAFFAVDGRSQQASLEKCAKELQAARYQCTTMLAPDEYQLLSVDAPNVPPDELKVAVRWRLKDMLDYHVDDATIDVLDVPVEKNGAARNHMMYVVAARNQTIQERQDLFGNARIPLSVIDIPEMVQRNISALLEEEGRGLAFLSFDAHGGLLTVTYGGEMYLARRIELTLPQLEQAGQGQRVAYFDRITLELQRSFDHFDRQFHFITVARIVLGPMGEMGAALQAYLAEQQYIPVTPLDLEEILDITKVPHLKQSGEQQRYFMAIGMALRHEEKEL